MRALLGADALVVTPGRAPAWAEAGDQARVATPAQALARGASHLVIGRPITGGADPPRGASTESLAEIEGATAVSATDRRADPRGARGGAMRSGTDTSCSRAGGTRDTYVQCARMLEDPALTTALARNRCSAPSRGARDRPRRGAGRRRPHHRLRRRAGARGQVHLQRARAGRDGLPPGVRGARGRARAGGGRRGHHGWERRRGHRSGPRGGRGSASASSSLIDRGGDEGVRRSATGLCFDLRLSLGTPHSCSLCADGVPVYSPGSRATFDSDAWHIRRSGRRIVRAFELSRGALPRRRRCGRLSPACGDEEEPWHFRTCPTRIARRRSRRPPRLARSVPSFAPRSRAARCPSRTS